MSFAGGVGLTPLAYGTGVDEADSFESGEAGGARKGCGGGEPGAEDMVSSCTQNA
jgi:hypothetical protein